MVVSDPLVAKGFLAALLAVDGHVGVFESLALKSCIKEKVVLVIRKCADYLSLKYMCGTSVFRESPSRHYSLTRGLELTGVGHAERAGQLVNVELDLHLQLKDEAEEKVVSQIMLLLSTIKLKKNSPSRLP